MSSRLIRFKDGLLLHLKVAGRWSALCSRWYLSPSRSSTQQCDDFLLIASQYRV